MFFVGSALTREQCRRIARAAPNARLINLYGTTETQRSVGYFEVPAELTRLPDVIPIGRGMKDVEVCVLNRDNERCPPFQIGEIMIRSRHIALGYLGDPERTSARFRDLDSVPAYLTGDLGYHAPEHGVVFTGRADSQYKINGYRVELETINEACRGLPQVRDAATVVVEVDELPTIATFLVPDDPIVRFDPVRVRGALEDRLPRYMLPHRITTVDELPMTRNRKIDTAALARRSQVEQPPRDGDVTTFVTDFVRRHTAAATVPTDVPLAALGIDSLRMASLVSQLADESRRTPSGLHNRLSVAEFAAVVGGPEERSPMPAEHPESTAINIRRQLGPVADVTESRIRFGERWLDHCCSNSYLGLGGHPGIRRRVTGFVRERPPRSAPTDRPS